MNPPQHFSNGVDFDNTPLNTKTQPHLQQLLPQPVTGQYLNNLPIDPYASQLSPDMQLYPNIGGANIASTRSQSGHAWISSDSGTMHVPNQDAQNLQPTPLEHSYSFPLPERSGDLTYSGISRGISEPHHNVYHADRSSRNSRYVTDDTWASSERGINNVDMQDSQASIPHINSSQTPWQHSKIEIDTHQNTANFC